MNKLSVVILFLSFWGWASLGQNLNPKEAASETAVEARFAASDTLVTVNFSFTNGTKRLMYLTNDGSADVKSVRFEPTETCVLISKLQKPSPGNPDVEVNTTRVMPGKKYSGTLTWEIPLHHKGPVPQGWSKTDKPKCQTLRLELAAIPGYSDLDPQETTVDGKTYYRLSKEARRHQETQTADAEGFDIPLTME